MQLLLFHDSTYHVYTIYRIRVHISHVYHCTCTLTGFSVGWASGRASGLSTLTDEVLVLLPVCSKVHMICMLSSWCHCHPIIPCFITTGCGLKNNPLQKSHYFQNNLIFFSEIFRGYSWDILPLVLQILAFQLHVDRNGTGLNIKDDFLKWTNKHKNQIKTILHTNFKLRHVWSAEKPPAMTRREYYRLNDRPLQWMFKVSATSVDTSVQTPLWKLKYL